MLLAFRFDVCFIPLQVACGWLDSKSTMGKNEPLVCRDMDERTVNKRCKRTSWSRRLIRVRLGTIVITEDHISDEE
jgi:hypothetical protein